jgi:lipid A 3-O-deacylase
LTFKKGRLANSRPFRFKSDVFEIGKNMRRLLACLIITVSACVILPESAMAQEVFLGGAFGGVDTPFSLDIGERGAAVQIGYRAAPQKGLKAIGSPSPYVLASVNVDGKTSFVAVGLSWKFGDKVYVRPGIGLALNDNATVKSNRLRQRIDLGSVILFEPELAIGAKLLPDLAIEAAWTHISHAQIFGGQNPGLDVIGVRMVKKLR